MDILGIAMCTCPPEYTGTTCEGKITSPKTYISLLALATHL